MLGLINRVLSGSALALPMIKYGCETRALKKTDLADEIHEKIDGWTERGMKR